MLALSPVVPLATHASVAAVDQHRIVSTIRGTEVAADPTTALALEAAVRRHRLLEDDPRSAARIRLAASQRILRAQRFEDDGALPHFHLLGIVTAGRDVGDQAFEEAAVLEHLGIAIRTARASGAEAVEVDLTDFTGQRWRRLCDNVHRALAGRESVRVLDRRDRPSGAGYYQGLCFKVFAVMAGERVEIGDGGLVDWTQRLVASRKERLLISGLGLERLIPPPT
jgi:hypothetical protein